ncbi:MAG: hypothetical protein U5Q16_02130 [Gammaproteobacteria bacterium]|nr:hypothetical protein [Gammaproteobacteria bacterium]
MHNRLLSVITVLLLAGVPAFAVAATDTSGVENLRETGKAFASVARSVSPSVVFLQVESTRERGGRQFGPDDFLRRFFGDQFPGVPDQQPERERRVFGQGSGFVFARRDGKAYVMTNDAWSPNAERIDVVCQHTSSTPP